jgi:stearoyl-CoA desaturase (Delta-9 desaturase)
VFNFAPKNPEVSVLANPVLVALEDVVVPQENKQVHEYEKVSFAMKTAIILAIAFPIIGVVAAPFCVWGWGFGWTDLALLMGGYIITGLGITVGYHRLFVHRSFETYNWVKFIFGVLGSMAFEGTLFHWSAMHRRHHQHSDTHDDPHSPSLHGGGVKGVLKGFWHAHMGWLFSDEPSNLDRYIKDLKQSKTLTVVSNLFPLWALLSVALPAVIGGLVSMSWSGALTGFVWGSLVRIFVVHHITWCVNSVCHIWGTRPYKSNDDSTNNTIVGILALGEGWHNAHHAFPTSARHGLKWWQFDLSWMVIQTLRFLGLAWNVKVPTQEHLAKSMA